MLKKVGGLSLTSPQDAMKAFMSKWVIHALLPGKSNLQIIMSHRITHLQHSLHGPWGPSSLWLFFPQFCTKGGSKVWHHISQSCKVMAKTVTYLSPTTPKDILQLNLWWKEEYQGLYFGIVMSRAYTLNMNGLRYFRDNWDLGRYDFLNWEHAEDKFSLEVHCDFWLKLTEFYRPFREIMLNQKKTPAHHPRMGWFL